MEGWERMLVINPTILNRKLKGDEMRYMKTKKEIKHRINEIFKESDPKTVSLNEVEQARLLELEWVLGI